MREGFKGTKWIKGKKRDRKNKIPVGARDFSFLQMSTPALGLTKPPIQWVPGFCLEGKAAGA